MWVKTSEELPEIGDVVLTKIDEGFGQRNITKLKRGGSNVRLWFLEDGSMYVYYTPTHWFKNA